jgi:hypothetical protein
MIDNSVLICGTDRGSLRSSLKVRMKILVTFAHLAALRGEQ